MSSDPEKASEPCEAAADPTSEMARTLRLALDIYKDPEKTEQFLIGRHPMLDGTSPLQVILSGADGARRVTNLLGRAAYGGAV